MIAERLLPDGSFDRKALNNLPLFFLLIRASRSERARGDRGASTRGLNSPWEFRVRFPRSSIRAIAQRFESAFNDRTNYTRAGSRVRAFRAGGGLY